jgi:hypothetical protein
MPVRHREEVLNTVLAEAIVARGLNATPESIRDHGRQRPDVMIAFRGLRCVIEGKIADVANARAIVLQDATARVEKGVAHLAIAAVYPKVLRSTPFDHLLEACSQSPLDFAVCSERGATEWRSGGIDDILDELRRAHETLARDDVVQEVAAKLEAGLQEVAQILFDDATVCDRLIPLLGIGEPENEEAD